MYQMFTSGPIVSISKGSNSHLWQRRSTRRPSRKWNAAIDRRNFEQWHSAMVAGRFSEAWKINDENAQHWPSAHQLWNGESVAGRSIELQALHGFGDFVQMMRFVPDLNQLGCTVSFNIRPELRSLLPCFVGDFQVSEAVAPDHRCLSMEIMELLYALRVRTSDLPTACYLKVTPALAAYAGTQMNPASRLPKVGIVWSGSTWDPERWIPEDQLKQLLELDCCEWWSMQGPESCGLPSAHLRQVTTGGLLEFAAAIQNLDLLITVDTLAAHIAGAMGKPVWVLLKKEADWRWLRGRADSPWYPSMRLIRQTSTGDWPEVLDYVKTELEIAFGGASDGMEAYTATISSSSCCFSTRSA